MYKTLHRKLKLEQYEHAKKIRELTQVFRKCLATLECLCVSYSLSLFLKILDYNAQTIDWQETNLDNLVDIYINVCIFYIYLTPENATYFIKFCQSH
jgi:hypothetical protein